MTALIYLIPVALFLGTIGLGAFFWTVKSGQYEDLDGDGSRFLHTEDKPIVDQDAD